MYTYTLLFLNYDTPCRTTMPAVKSYTALDTSQMIKKYTRYSLATFFYSHL